MCSDASLGWIRSLLLLLLLFIGAVYQHIVDGRGAERSIIEFLHHFCVTISAEPIRGQCPGHVITLDQSEASVQTAERLREEKHSGSEAWVQGWGHLKYSNGMTSL